jgi:hypothetical protein
MPHAGSIGAPRPVDGNDGQNAGQGLRKRTNEGRLARLAYNPLATLDGFLRCNIRFDSTLRVARISISYRGKWGDRRDFST